MLSSLSTIARSSIRLPARRALTVAPRSRLLHSTRPVMATEGGNPLAHLKDNPVLQQVSSNPAALAAISEFVQLLQSKGMDMTSKPSMMQLMKFMADSDVRAGAKKLSETFQKAGINFGSKEAMSFMSAMEGMKKP